MTGDEILARLRTSGSAVPVIVLTVQDAVSDRGAMLNAGADDYVSRPYDFEELLARIRRVFAPRTTPSPRRSRRGGSRST